MASVFLKERAESLKAAIRKKEHIKIKKRDARITRK